jgi:TonB-linked SusC/RagA family outer membrane protein
VVQRISLVSLALSLAVGVGAAAGQQRAITGKVVSTSTSEPIAGATVSVLGTPIAAITNDRGEFSLSAPQGAVTLLVRGVGFRSRQVPVAADVSSAAVSLEQDVFNLEAVVVTGQATGVSQRNLANAVTTVPAEQLNRAPVQTLEGALQGKIPGALIQMNSGAPGGGGQINLRGVTTINAGVDPLIVVDGMIIANDAIVSNMDAITAAAAGGNPRPQDNAVNRIADLNPNDIQNIEVLKGASAAAIYGGQAANGVVIITTRRGRPGAARFSVTQRFGTFDAAGHLGSRAFRDSVEADAVFGSRARAYCNIGPTGACPVFDNEGVLYGRHPLAVETDASVTGGNDQTSYYLSGLVKKEDGIATGTGYQKQSIRANVDQLLGSRFKASVNLNAIHSVARRGISNNDNTATSPFMVFPNTPSFIDLREQNGVWPANAFSQSNPLETFAKVKNTEDVWRILGTSTARVDAVTTATQRLQFTLMGGLDYFSQRNDILSPADLQFEPQDGQPGTVVLGKSSDLRLNLVGSAVHTYTPASNAFQATTSAGFQYERRELNLTNAVGRTLALGLENVNQAASLTVPTQSLQLVKNLGLYAQEEVLAASQRLLLTVGGRADRSSVTGDQGKVYFYPKAAASYRFVQPMGGVDELKVRAAWGQTGNPPLYPDRSTLDSTIAIGGQVGQVRPFRFGLTAVTPERNTEVEAGFDATLGNQFATLGVTVYQKTVSDLLLEQSVGLSNGYQVRVFQGGKLRNRGIETALAVSPVRTSEVNWVVRSTFFLNRSNIVELPIPAFNTGGFGLSLGAFRIEKGKSATQIVGLEGVVGDATPDFQMSLSSDLDYKRFSLGFLWDWKRGGDIVNLTQLLYDAVSNSADQLPAGNARISTWASGKTQVYVQDGSYLKLREVTLGYNLAPGVAQHFGMRTARLSISGRNLLRFTPYKGLDPEVSNFANQAIVRNIDVAPFPPSRSFFFSIDLGF